MVRLSELGTTGRRPTNGRRQTHHHEGHEMQHFLSYPTNLVAVCGAGMIGRRNSLKDSDPDLTTCSACRATKAWEDAAETVTANARQDAADWAAARAATGKARIVKTGSSDYGYVSAVCDAPECVDKNGRPWAQMYSRRTVEGYDLAERDADAHNRVRHPAAPEHVGGIPLRVAPGPSDHVVAEVRDTAGTVLGYITKADVDAYADRPPLTEAQQMIERLNERIRHHG